MTAMQGPSRLRFMGGAALLLVLLAGGLSGAAIDRAVSRRQPVRERDECARFRQEESRRSSHGPYGFLDLSTEQQARMDAILENRRTQLDEFWAQNRPRMDSIVEGARAELLDVLTPEQRTEVDQRNERRRAEWRALEERCAEQIRQEQEAGRGGPLPEGRRGQPAPRPEGRRQQPFDSTPRLGDGPQPFVWTA